MDLLPSAAPNFSSSAPLAATAALPWEVAQGSIQPFNQQAAAWYGGAATALLGRPLAEAPLPHKLVPVTLRELSLAAASLLASRQLALYRSAQQLAQNIAKHALGATEASPELETMFGWVLLRAEGPKTTVWALPQTWPIAPA